MLCGGAAMAHGAMMNSCPTYNLNHQMSDPFNHGIVRETRYNYSEFKPKIEPVLASPSPSLVRDPILKLARAEEDYHSSLAITKPVEIKSPESYLTVMDYMRRQREREAREFAERLGSII